MKVELKLADGRVVEWSGTDELNAAERYVDCHREAVVVATRPGDRHGIFALGRGSRIIG